MFKSSFAQDLLQETRQQRSLTEEILPKEIRGQAGGGGGGYKSQFAASTHGPLDTVTVEDTEVREVTRRPASVINESGHELGGLGGLGGHTSDLGTSDFSSSELWPGPGSTSSSPFEYSPRYRSREASTSILAEPAPPNTRLTSTSSSASFLNLQSSMQFSYLKRACMELDLGLDEDDWNSIATNLLKDFNKNIRNVAISSLENFVNLGDFLSEIQSLTDEKRRRQPADDNSNYNQNCGISEEDLADHLSSKALTAKLAAKELETLQVRLECQQLYTSNLKLREEFRQLKQMANPKKYLELQKEIEHLHWQLNKMENSRKLYELATGQLVSFLEQVSSSLQAGPGPRTASQASIAEPAGLLSPESILHAKRLSLASLDMARSQSMPGLADSLQMLTLPRGRGSSTSSSRRVSGSGAAREKRVRRSSSVSKTRVSSASPLPSLAETADDTVGGAARSGSEGSQVTSPVSTDNQSTDSFPLYPGRGRSLATLSPAPSSDPLCVSTPKSYKAGRGKAVSVVELSGSCPRELSPDKRGTLTSLSSSSSSASPPSSSEASGGSAASASLQRPRERARPASAAQHTRSLSSLLSEPKVSPVPVSKGQPKVVLASRAGRLLRSVRLLMAREKSYDVSQGRGSGRGSAPAATSAIFTGASSSPWSLGQY